MRDLLIGSFESGYMQRALIEVLLLSLIGGLVGVHVILRRLAFLTEVVQHGVFPGIAIAFVAGWSLLVGAIGAGLIAVALFTIMNRRRDLDADALMALIVATFFAIGVIVVSRGVGYQSNLTSLLFGRILSVDRGEIVDTMIIAVVVVAVLAALHKELVLRAFDVATAQAMGYRIGLLDLVLNILVLLTVIAAVRAIGTVLLVAFLITPGAAAQMVFRRVVPMMVFAVVFAAVCGWVGLAISFRASVDHGWRLASGATVVAALTIGLLIVAAVQQVVRIVRGRAFTTSIGTTDAADVTESDVVATVENSAVS